MIKKIIIFLLFVNFITIPVWGDNDQNIHKENNTEEPKKENTGVITGVVLDEETNEPLVGVKVILEGTDKIVYTDFDGYFQFDKIEAGRYNIITNYVSYITCKHQNILVSTQIAGEYKLKINNYTKRLSNYSF